MDPQKRFTLNLSIDVIVTDPLKLATENDQIGTINGEPGVLGGDSRGRVNQAVTNALRHFYANSEDHGFQISSMATRWEDHVPIPGDPRDQ